ncbi:MAG: type transport system permease protein [Chloroflexota bacterium]|nr:type transport system permease protein [Chloroflexota bacterium]
MSLRRTFVLYARELRASAGNFLMVFALVVPVVFSLLINLVFGEAYSGRPVLGFYDPYGSQFTQLMMAQTHLKSSAYDSLDRMIADVDMGAIETGYVVPQGFDQALRDGTPIDFTVYAWGEASLKSRLITDTTIANVISQIAGLPQTAQVVLQPLGPAEQESLADKLLPLLILMSMMLGGVMVPALSMIGEKQNRTLLALNVTPTRLSEVFAAKILLGVTMGTATGLVTLLLNRAFGGQPLLLVAVMLLGSLASSLLGALLGALSRDMNTLLATLKGGGILLIGPGIVDLIPRAPDWIARLFPTYYILNPVMQIAERGAGLGDIWGDLLVLLGLMLLMVLAIGRVIARQQKRLALL